MRIIVYIIITLTLFVLTSCSNTIDNQGKQDQNIPNDQLYYDKEEQETNDNPAKQYLQNNEKGIGRGGEERSIFETDEGQEIASQLSLRDDVKQAQVATTDDEVAVFVYLRDYQDPYIANSLEEEIKQIVPDKDIFVYTDKVHWKRLKDLDSSMKARDVGNDLEKFLEDNLNIKIKD